MGHFCSSIVEALPSSDCFTTCMGAHFPAVELDNAIRFNFTFAILHTKKAKNTYFEMGTENGIMGSKKFWSTIKSFFHQMASFKMITFQLILIIKSLKMSLNCLKIYVTLYKHSIKNNW